LPTEVLDRLHVTNIKRQQEIKAKNTLDEVKFRFYNLAGNPMMVRLADGIIDVVFDLIRPKTSRCRAGGIYRDDGWC